MNIYVYLSDKQCNSTYLADGTYTFAFPANAFSGLGTLQSMFAVGTLPTVHCVMASYTLPTRNPLQQTKTNKKINKGQDGLFAHQYPRSAS